METAKELRAKIVDKAAEDAEFRARLLSDPKGAIEQELNVTIPASMTVKVHEESGATAHLVLPPARLSGDQLQKAAAGFVFTTTPDFMFPDYPGRLLINW